MSDFARRLNFSLPPGQSTFLWGARKTGKSTWLHAHFPDSVYYDLLQTDLMLELSRHPATLREQLLAKDLSKLKGPVILDEVQKVPSILDEVQWLIETQKLNFILCGSSARKLKRGHANLLGGRAWRFEMYPLTSAEVPGLSLLQALNRGLSERRGICGRTCAQHRCVLPVLRCRRLLARRAGQLFEHRAR